MIHWKPSKRGTLLALLFACCSLSLANAQSCEEGSPAAYFDIYESNQIYFCQLPFNPGIVSLTVVVNAVPFQKVRLTLPDPPLGLVFGATWEGTTTGDRFTGLEIDMGSCVGPGVVALGTLTALVNTGDTAPCTDWSVGAGCEVQDCSGDWRPAIPVPHQVGTGYCECLCWQCCYWALAPYDLYPLNGATAVPLDVVLSWNGTPEEFIDPPPYGGCSVSIGTSPDCTSGTSYPVSCSLDQFAPDFLVPNTTYYWRVSWSTPPSGCSDLNGGYSPLYSFTTRGPNATEQKTWGYVKSMYR